MRGFAVVAAFSVGLGASAAADGNAFTAADVLTWTYAQQNAFFEASVAMAGVLAVQAENPAGQCINDWYFKTESGKSQANAQIREVMTQYSGYYPGTVIVAVIERECGDLTPSN